MARLLTPEEKQEINQGIDRTDSAPSELNDEMLALARELSNIHGRIRVAREESGLHFYMASPVCLEDDGAIELQKMHLLRPQRCSSVNGSAMVLPIQCKTK